MSSAILIIVLCVLAAIGALVGFFKKFHKTSFWGVTVLLTVLLVQAIGSGLNKEDSSYGWIIIIASAVILVILTAVIGILRNLLKKAVLAKKQLSHYKNYDSFEENEAYILNAVDKNNKKEYKRRLKANRKIKDSAGGWGVADSILGAVSGAINLFVGIGAIMMVVLAMLQIADFPSLTEALSEVYTSAAWTDVAVKYILDVPLLCILSLSIRLGYKNGIFNVLCIVVVLGLLVGSGYISFHIATSAACEGAVEGLKNSLLASFTQILGDMTTSIAQFILTAIIFILFLIPVILVGVFLPKVVEKIRDAKVVSVIDGLIGSVVLTVVIVGVLMAAGGVAYTLNDLEFMAQFNKFEAGSCLGNALYTYNPLADVFAALPFHDWFVQPAQPEPDPETFVAALGL